MKKKKKITNRLITDIITQLILYSTYYDLRLIHYLYCSDKIFGEYITLYVCKTKKVKKNNNNKYNYIMFILFILDI